MFVIAQTKGDLRQRSSCIGAPRKMTSFRSHQRPSLHQAEKSLNKRTIQRCLCRNTLAVVTARRSWAVPRLAMLAQMIAQERRVPSGTNLGSHRARWNTTRPRTQKWLLGICERLRPRLGLGITVASPSTHPDSSLFLTSAGSPLSGTPVGYQTSAGFLSRDFCRRAAQIKTRSSC
jgi:hypothetical protein